MDLDVKSLVPQSNTLATTKRCRPTPWLTYEERDIRGLKENLNFSLILP